VTLVTTGKILTHIFIMKCIVWHIMHDVNLDNIELVDIIFRVTQGHW